MFRAQDTVFTTQGSIIVGAILEQADGYLAIQELNANDVTVITNNKLLIVKKGNEKPVVLYNADTLITKSGRVSMVKVIGVTTESVSYINTNGSSFKIFQYPAAELFMVKFSDGTVENFTPDVATAIAYSAQSGTNDAKMYHQVSPGLIAGEYFLGLTSFTLYPFVAGLIIATKTPNQLDNPQNPRNIMLYKDPVYKDAYAKQAKIQKKKKAIPPFLAGIGSSFIGLYLLFNL
jgi:hypothetical protein